MTTQTNSQDTKFKPFNGQMGGNNAQLTSNPCPTCGAEAGFDCYSRNGKRLSANGRSTPHAARNPQLKRDHHTSYYMPKEG